MGSVYTFLKFFTPIFLLISCLVAGWFLFKWVHDPLFEIGPVSAGPILNFEQKILPDDHSQSLKVISYNLGYASGPMQHTLADDHPKSFFNENLDDFISMVQKRDADIVLLQEVDIDSKRTWYVDQLEYIMSALGWGYAAPVIDWDLYFPLRKEKKITKASVVISKYPITDNDYATTSCKPNFENKLLNIFYYPLLWKSTMQRVEVQVGERSVSVYNVHLCVWNRAARVAQSKFLTDWIKKNTGSADYIIGGDFNFQAYIRGTPVPHADMTKEPFLNIFWQNLPGVKEIKSNPGESAEIIHKLFTFPERKHRYDFIFYSGGLKLVNSEIIEGLDSSDHLPVAAVFEK